MTGFFSVGEYCTIGIIFFVLSFGKAALTLQLFWPKLGSSMKTITDDFICTEISLHNLPGDTLRSQVGLTAK